MADQADVVKARELLTDLHDGHHVDKFQQDWSKVSKDHRAAVEAEMKRQEAAFRTLYPGSGNFAFKEDASSHALEVDQVNARGQVTKVEYKEAASRTGPIGTDQGKGKQPTESPQEVAERNRRAEAADNQIKANHYLQALGGVGPDGRPIAEPQATDDRNKAIKDFNELPPSKRAAVAATMQEQQLQHPGTPAVANIYNPDGTIKEAHTSTELLNALKNEQPEKFSAIYNSLSPAQRAIVGRAMQRENDAASPVRMTPNPDGSIRSVDAVSRDEKNRPITVHEYRSPEQLKDDATQALGNLRTHDKGRINQFSEFFMSLPPDQRAALTKEMLGQEKAYEDAYPRAPKMILSVGPDETLKQVDIQAPNGKYQKEWNPPKDDFLHRWGRRAQGVVIK